LLAVALLALGCGEDPFTPLPDAPRFDSMMPDGDAVMPDADGMLPDSGVTPDSSVTPDSGVTPDSATPDSATPDSATPDSQTPDSATPDSATPDSPAPDAATPDSPTPDAATPDSATPDAPTTDAATPDSATPDSPAPDAGVDPDSAIPDAPRFDAGVDPDTSFDSPQFDAGGDPDSGGGFDAPTDAGGVAIPACPVDTWCTEPSPIAGKLLTGVWAVSANDVFAVGAGGTILRRHDGTHWTQMTSNTTADFAGVWAASANDVWAVGESGLIRRFDGLTWNTVNAGVTIDLNAVWGSGPNDVWMVGPGRVVHWNGSQFDSAVLPGELFALSGTSPTDVWTTGETAFVDHFDGTWTTGIKPDGNTSTFFAIHAIASDNVFVSGFTPTKETMQFDGTSWTARSCKLGTSSCIFQGFFSTSATDVWGAGGTKVGHWNGTAWTAEAPAGAMVQFFDVSGAEGHVWVVGSNSLIIHRN
jgi:hypothetical protein